MKFSYRLSIELKLAIIDIFINRIIKSDTKKSNIISTLNKL